MSGSPGYLGDDLDEAPSGFYLGDDLDDDACSGFYLGDDS
jgi:hypothetical protein